MSDPVSPTTSPPATDVDGKLLLAPEQAQALLRECFVTFRSGLIDVVATSIDGTNDLFEQNKFVTDVEVADFRSKRPEWRSEERRVGKECRSRWWTYDLRKRKTMSKTQK